MFKRLLKQLLGNQELSAVEELGVGIEMGSKSANDAVRTQLMNHGDDGTQSRNVRHYAYPGFLGENLTDSSEKVAKKLKSIGFVVFNAENDGLRFEENSEIASSGFDERTSSVNQVIDEAGWHYDGWEAELIVKPSKG